jgi:hypothetical protein
VGRLERGHPSPSSNVQFFRTMSRAIELGDANGLAGTIIKRFDDIKRNLDDATTSAPTELNRNHDHA